jgi:hypothetical protein
MNLFLTRVVVLVALLGGTHHSGFCQDEIGIYVPPFSGELGNNVGTVLWLKVWRTLIIPSRKGAPSAAMWWRSYPYPEDFQEVEDDVKDTAIRIVLWGNTINFGDGVLAQPLF